MQTAIVYFFCILSAFAALGILFIKDIFKAVLLLLLCLLSLAGIYVMQFAEFVAVTQILIYAGGIVVVMIFAIMLTTKMSGVPLKIGNTNVVATVLGSSSMLIMLIYMFSNNFDRVSLENSSVINSVKQTGLLLMSTYILPFEIAGFLLLIALIGAAVVSTSNARKI